MKYLQIVIYTLNVLFFAKADDSVAVCVCEQADDGPPKLSIFYNSENGVIGVNNASSKVGFILDYEHNIMKIANGPSLTDLFVDYNTNTAYLYYDDGLTKHPSFGDWFGALTPAGLIPITEEAKSIVGGTKLSELSPALAEQIVMIMTNLVGSFSPEYIIYRDLIIEQLKGPLGQLYKGKGSFDVHKDLGTFVKLNLIIAAFLRSADDVQSIQLDPEVLFSDETGPHTLLKFMDQVGDQANLLKIFRTLLRSKL